MGLNSFENAFPTLSQIISNPREFWDGEVRKTEGTYLDYGAWATEPLKAFDSLTVSFGTALPQAAAMAYGMGPTIASAGPTVGEFLIDTKNLGSALGKPVVRAVDNVGSKMLPPPPFALAMAGGGVMAMSGEVSEAVVAGSGMQEPALPIILMMSKPTTVKGKGSRSSRSRDLFLTNSCFEDIAERLSDVEDKTIDPRDVEKAVMHDVVGQNAPKEFKIRTFYKIDGRWGCVVDGPSKIKLMFDVFLVFENGRWVPRFVIQRMLPPPSPG